MAETLLDPESKMYQFLLRSSVRKVFELHASGRQDNHKILFSLVLFEEWLRAHEENAVALN
jgi:asparagine synthase (glutamine-hydrolysing)